MLLPELSGPQPGHYLSAAIDPIALFMIVGAGLLMAGLIYAIFSPDDDGKGTDQDDLPSGGS